MWSGGISTFQLALKKHTRGVSSQASLVRLFTYTYRGIMPLPTSVRHSWLVHLCVSHSQKRAPVLPASR